MQELLKDLVIIKEPFSVNKVIKSRCPTIKEGFISLNMVILVNNMNEDYSTTMNAEKVD